MKLTKATAGRLTLPRGKAEAIHFDDDIPGFGFRLQGKSRAWIFQYKIGAKHRRMTFGKFPALNAAKAREQAGELHAKVRLGQDPAGEKDSNRARAIETFEAVQKRYLADQRERLKPRSYAEIERHLATHCQPLHGLSFGKIEQRTIATRLAEIRQKGGPVAANRVRSTLSALFSWAMSEGLTETNLVLATKKNDEAPRERVLLDKELRSIWNALPDGDYGSIVKLLILTGQRKQEISDLRWSEIDFRNKVIRLPAGRTKNGRAHQIPMPGAVQSILEAQDHIEDRDFVFGQGQGGFSGFSRCKHSIAGPCMIFAAPPLPAWPRSVSPRM
jgi:integrase